MGRVSRSALQQQVNDAAQTEDAEREIASSLYVDFTIWMDRKKKPSWHPVKKMRYVFFRMIHGVTITDALKEIRWSPSEFWHLIDLKRNDPFRQEYNRAKILQGRAIGDSVVSIAEGRDVLTKRSVTKMQKTIKKYLIRAGKQKTTTAARAVIESLLGKLDENGRNVINRNKVQIDAAKWLAKSVNPGEFSDSSKLSLGGLSPGDGDAVAPIIIQFIGPDGSVVEP